MYKLIRSLLFKLDPETAHKLTLNLLHFLPKIHQKPTQPRCCMGLNFPHSIGLAAGLDKNGEHLDALAKLGFSFIEVGTVTPKPQFGNPKPRLFRLPNAEAIINRMGFNNSGVEVLVHNIQKAKYACILGINIGKNKETSLNCAFEDYLYCLRKVYQYASYVTINISSPNTPDLRILQQEKYLQHLLTSLIEEQKYLTELHQVQVPLLIKLSPDEDSETLKKMADIILQTGVAGIIATNTTCSRIGVEGLPHANESGGLSGKPLFARSTECLSIIKQIVGNAVTLIGVGGIDSAETAKAKFEAGADLLQVYSGFIYKGPKLIQELAKL
jgi:dihydroorotate dehydrogenase